MIQALDRVCSRPRTDRDRQPPSHLQPQATAGAPVHQGQQGRPRDTHLARMTTHDKERVQPTSVMTGNPNRTLTVEPLNALQDRCHGTDIPRNGKNGTSTPEPPLPVRQSVAVPARRAGQPKLRFAINQPPQGSLWRAKARFPFERQQR